jgi:hypothetical protein
MTLSTRKKWIKGENKVSKFYATATNPKGVSFIIPFLNENGREITRTEASNRAESHCKKNGLTLDGGGIRIFKGTKDNSSVLTKFAKARKAKRGVKGWKETF